jgi:hypothetical protein
VQMHTRPVPHSTQQVTLLNHIIAHLQAGIGNATN